MTPPAVQRYGSSEVEPFSEYYARWPRELSNFPRCVVENWVHRHWTEFSSHWANRNIHQFEFEDHAYTNEEVMQIGHTGDWSFTLDHWGDELFRNSLRKSTWLASSMLESGTTPAPIIVSPNSGDLQHPSGGMMHPLQLIEGHLRLAYLRGMIRHDHKQLKPAHRVWQVTLPNNSFKPRPLRGSAAW